MDDTNLLHPAVLTLQLQSRIGNMCLACSHSSIELSNSLSVELVAFTVSEAGAFVHFAHTTHFLTALLNAKRPWATCLCQISRGFCTSRT
eukprot:3005766-Amphidinium_carterae.2